MMRSTRLALGCALTLLCALEFSQASLDVPSDWQAAVAAGDMLFAATAPAPGLEPNVGNGFIAAPIGPPVLYAAGVFNGISNVTVSHRALLPSVWQIVIPSTVAGDTPQWAESGGAALDMRGGVFYNRTAVWGPLCPEGALVEMRYYAHQLFHDLLVLEMAVLNMTDTACVVQWWGNFSSVSPDFNSSAAAFGDNGTLLWTGETLLPEVEGLPVRRVAIAFDAPLLPPLSGQAWEGGVAHKFTAAEPSLLQLASVHSDLDAPSPVTTATANLALYASLTGAELQASHAAAWAVTWESGIELAGNLTVAGSVNSSLYYILSAAWGAWPYGIQPGGLATDDYNGHTFWDQETWMFPNLLLLHQDYASAQMLYRATRAPESAARAAWYGFDGVMYAWESAFTGFDCVPPPHPEGRYEQHITGDVAMAVRQYYAATGSLLALEDLWPVVGGACEFFACRASTVGVDSGAADCGVKAGPPYTLLFVQPPDESAGVINSSAYTNAIAAATLQFCIDAGALLNISTPPEYADIAANMFLNISDTLYPGGPVHLEYSNYSGQTINQADVALLQYPLQFPMDEDIARNDLAYYQSVTDSDGYFTGDSAYSIAWLALGNRSAADAQFATAFLHMDIGHFNVWKERAITGGNLNFITGAGGYLQSFLYGYAMLRLSFLDKDLATPVLSFGAPVLPPSIDSVRLRAITFQGVTFDLSYNESALCVVLSASVRDAEARDVTREYADAVRARGLPAQREALLLRSPFQSPFERLHPDQPGDALQLVLGNDTMTITDMELCVVTQPGYIRLEQY